MKDVTPNSIYTKDKKQISQILVFLLYYLKNPIHKIKVLPNWNWKYIILLQIIIGLISGSLWGLVSMEPLSLWAGLIALPLSSSIITFLMSAFLYYSFLFIASRTIPLKDIAQLLVLAHLPFFIFHPLASIIPPMDLIGFAFSAILSAVGAVENFDLSKTLVLKTVGFIYITFSVCWIINLIL